MGRPSKVDDRRPKTLSLDSYFYREFEKIVGYGNVSEEIRAFIKDRVEQEQGIKPKPMDNNYMGIFQEFDMKDKRDEIRKYIDREMDMTKLNILYKNCNTIVGMIDTRKEQNYAKAEFDRRQAQKSNEEIEKEIKKQRRRLNV